MRLGPIVAIVCAFAALPLSLSAEQQRPDLSTLSGGLTSLYRSARANLIGAAELMPEEHYGFKPTEDVRTFGQLVGHVTNTHYNFCAPAREVARPDLPNAETLTSKSELVAALKASLAFCDPIFEGLTDDVATSAAKWGQMPITKGYALVYNIAHDNEHYGNMVTYLRLKGIVPPSSARR